MPQTNGEVIRATIKVREAAQIADCGERAIRKKIADGSLPHIRFGRSIRISRSAFLRWLESCGTR
jgi:excisionase family DNA binding protein